MRKISLCLGLLLFCFPSFAAVKKVYWLIPDGMRADPEEFNVFRWAEEGKLPNLKFMMEHGAYGYSIPDFPSHTPTNFATLLTGTHPDIHGIADGPMHTEGAPLVRPSAAGFSSQSKKVAPVWTIMEREQQKKVVLLSIPGSTPPELSRGITIRGRWGGWGADTPNLIFESAHLLAKRRDQGKAFRLFYFGAPLTVFTPTDRLDGWDPILAKNRAHEATLSAYGLKIFALLPEKHAKEFIFSFDKKHSVASLRPGEWSRWIPAEITYKDVKLADAVRIKVIKAWPNGDFRIRVLFNQLNDLITEPSYVAADLTKALGPMVDFADNWPAQLVYEPEDKGTFLDEARMSWNWHRSAVPYILKKYQPDIFIQDIYTPNLMLESKWWYAAIDKSRPDYSAVKAKSARKDLLKLYQGLDAILGEMLKKRDKNTLVVFSSDHGVCHLHRLVKLNNLFAKKGWLKFRIDPVTGEAAIDWENTKVIYLKMANIFVSPGGLAGNWQRAKGPAYEKLRDEVMAALRSLKDENGKKPLANVVKWEDAERVYHLPLDRIGDLVLEANLGYFWHEEPTEDGKIFENPITTGYKQSIDARKNHCMWTPFVMMGEGVKAGFKIPNPISHADQLPTILKTMAIPPKPYMQGRVIREALER